MIVGKGLLANAFHRFKDDPSIFIFASGVSNSSSNVKSEFEREKLLLHDHLNLTRHATIIYFSTCSIYDPELSNSSYVEHKLEMEKLIRLSGNNFIIIRLSNPVGYTNNQNTLINYLSSKILGGLQFDLWNEAKRNIIDIDDVVTICSDVITDLKYLNKVINVANPNNYYVRDIVEILEKIYDKHALYKIINKGGSPIIDITEVEEIMKKRKISFSTNYLEDVLKKYLL